LRPVAVAQPADPGGQPLEGDPLRGDGQPALEQPVVGEGFEQRGVDPGDVVRIAGQGGPAERPGAPAEQRPDVGGHEPRKGESVCEAGVEGLCAQYSCTVAYM